MADYSFIANNPQGNPVNQLNGMVSLASGMQNYKRGNIEYQKEQQLNQDRLALQQFTSDPNNWQTDGKIDMEKINKVVPQIAPLAGPEYVARMTTLGTAQTQASEAKLKFSNQEREAVAGLYGVLGRAGVDDPKVVANEMDMLKKQFPDSPELAKYIDATKPALENLPAGQDLVRKTLITQSQSMLSPSEQNAALNPTVQTVNTGGNIQPVIAQPAVGGYMPSVSVPGQQPNAPIANTLPPTTTRVNPATGATEYVGSTGKGNAPVQASLGAGQERAFTSLVNKPLEANDYLVNSSPLLHDNVNNILSALKEGDITTGTAGPITAKVFSSLGIASDTAEQKASAYDLLGKRLAQNAQQLAQGFGPNTNAGLEQTTKGWGTEKYNHTAIETLTKQVGALVTLKDGYAKGIQIANQKGPQAIQAYDTQFGANSKIADALFVDSAKRGDVKGMQEAASELGYKPKGQFDPKAFLQSPQYNLMRHRLQNLDKLETTGSL